MRILLIICLLSLTACASKSERYRTNGNLANDSWQYGGPHRPTAGFTSKGGTWQDLGGGVTVIQKNGPNGQRSSEVLY